MATVFAKGTRRKIQNQKLAAVIYDLRDKLFQVERSTNVFKGKQQDFLENLIERLEQVDLENSQCNRRYAEIKEA